MFGKKTGEPPTTPHRPMAAAAVSGGAIQVAAHPLTSKAEGMATEAYEIYRYLDAKLETAEYQRAKRELISELVNQIDFQALERLESDLRRRKVREICDRILPNVAIPLTSAQINLIRDQALDELLGYGPLEPLLKDADVNDIMINTHAHVYVERHGKIYQTDVTFMDEQHLLGVIQRIVSRVGRRVDEASPKDDARSPDGSRFHAISPPLALDGALVSIRKF
ncbi:MAG: ATPase, T2SS/T4P/T4SS family, partial [Alphaproteobacteria bacterium]